MLMKLKTMPLLSHFSTIQARAHTECYTDYLKRAAQQSYLSHFEDDEEEIEFDDEFEDDEEEGEDEYEDNEEEE